MCDISKDVIQDRICVSASLAQHVDWLGRYAELESERIYLNHVGKDPARFVDAFGGHILPQLL